MPLIKEADGWTEFLSPAPDRDLGIQTEWNTHVVPWYAYGLCALLLAVVAARKGWRWWHGRRRS